MRLPPDTVIAREKITGYLLVPQTRGDKSQFLAIAGYTRQNPERLAQDLRALVQSGEALRTEANEFGEYYEIRGELTGPNGMTVLVRTIWITEHLSGVTKFVTLIPERRRRDDA